MIITHAHDDHTSALEDVVESFTVENYVDNGVYGQGQGDGSGAMEWVREVADEKGISVKGILDSEITDLPHKNGFTNEVVDPVSCDECDPRIVVLSGGDPAFPNVNDRSLVVRVDFGESSFLFTGDLQKGGIEPLLDYYADTDALDVDVYQVGHHGARNGTSTPMVQAMTPRRAVISVGRWDYWKTYGYGHPNQEAVLTDLSNNLAGYRSQAVRVRLGHGSRDFRYHWVRKRVYAIAWDGTVTIRAGLDDSLRTYVSRRSPAPRFRYWRSRPGNRRPARNWIGGRRGSR